MNILIADDDPICLKRLEHFFRSGEHQLFCATNGQEAWDIIESENLQIAILDWEMPLMSGVEICKTFRDKNGMDFLYIILLTSRNSRNDIAKGIDSGADDFLSKPVDFQELTVRLRAAKRIIQFQEMICKNAMIDALTGVLNRRAIFDQIAKEHDRTLRSGGSYSFVLCDIDHFKKINDVYGHPSGDHVLQVVAKRMSEDLRGSDCIGRYGGEEFLIILPECKEDEAAQIAERLRIRVSEAKIDLGGSNISVTTSFGVCENQRALSEIGVALKHADLALYQSKHQGRNCVTRFEDLRVMDSTTR
ncbi:GGDEF domain-containing response regulator [Planctomicrobium sp. SH668]|uniref:GGDEF domain-containing response regulator n=1 Tax=Planctomicrobium sp. SH668 TaxID=3448126 RepID=UPI003F5C7B98